MKVIENNRNSKLFFDPQLRVSVTTENNLAGESMADTTIYSRDQLSRLSEGGDVSGITVSVGNQTVLIEPQDIKRLISSGLTVKRFIEANAKDDNWQNISVDDFINSNNSVTNESTEPAGTDANVNLSYTEGENFVLGGTSLVSYDSVTELKDFQVNGKLFSEIENSQDLKVLPLDDLKANLQDIEPIDASRRLIEEISELPQSDYQVYSGHLKRIMQELGAEVFTKRYGSFNQEDWNRALVETFPPEKKWPRLPQKAVLFNHGDDFKETHCIGPRYIASSQGSNDSSNARLSSKKNPERFFEINLFTHNEQPCYSVREIRLESGIGVKPGDHYVTVSYTPLSQTSFFRINDDVRQRNRWTLHLNAFFTCPNKDRSFKMHLEGNH
jgi:hypothetical protein